MKIKNLVLAGALAAAAAAPFNAIAADKGEKSLGIFGALLFSDGSDTYIANLNMGQFINSNIETNFDYMLSYSEGDGFDMLMQMVGLSANYFIASEGKIVPYVGAGANITGVSTTSTTTDFFGNTYTTTSSDSYMQMIGRVGFRMPVNENADFDAKYEIVEPLDDQYEGISGIFLGFRVKF